MSEWVHISSVTEEVKKYIEQRRKGEIKSLRTGYRKLDASSINGFEWGSTITIGGRPGVGKSAMSDCLIRGFFSHNENDFDLLDFSWEMSSRVLLLRSISSEMQRSYKYICSAERNIISDEEQAEIDSILDNKYAKLPIYYVEKPETPQGFADTVRRFRDHHKRKLVVRVDHTILARMSKMDGDRVTMLLNLLGYANEIKKESDVIFIFLTQMNREFEARQEDSSDKAFPQQGDVFGGDSSIMFSENVILLNKPSRYNISHYGTRPGGVDVETHDLFAHIVKGRNSESGLIIRFEENFQNMNMEER
jgi:replicative DNA helicase